MKKDENAATITTSPSKSKGKSKKLTEATVAHVIEKVKGTKETRYIYPADVKTPEQKKSFRRNARAARSKYAKALATLRASTVKKDKIELKNLEKEQATWMLSTYTPEYQKSI